MQIFMVNHDIPYPANPTCCRGCIQRWHGIEKAKPLNENEIDYIVALIMGWIDQQLDESGHKSGHKTL
jgi:hypothetical protein